jgi:DNA-binding PadR family transcriptional regulator
MFGRHRHHPFADHCAQARDEMGWRGGGFMGRGWRDHGHPGRGGGRFFDTGELKFVVLHLLNEKPSHGYELIRAIEERLGGAYAPSPGVIYPTLTLLEEMGHIAQVDADGARKLFAVTDEGRAYLEQNQAVVDQALARMKLAKGRGGPPAPVLRAMENLKTALRLKLSRDDLSEAEVRAIAEAIDAAALAVERS